MTGCKSEKHQAFELQAVPHMDSLYRFGLRLRGNAADANNQQDLAFNNLLDDDVSGAVSDLPENFRTVIILRDIEGLTYDEIARFVECPLGTVRSRLHRGRKLLHSTLHDYARERGYGTLAQSSVKGLQSLL